MGVAAAFGGKGSCRQVQTSTAATIHSTSSHLRRFRDTELRVCPAQPPLTLCCNKSRRRGSRPLHVGLCVARVAHIFKRFAPKDAQCNAEYFAPPLTALQPYQNIAVERARKLPRFAGARACIYETEAPIRRADLMLCNERLYRQATGQKIRSLRAVLVLNIGVIAVYIASSKATTRGCYTPVSTAAWYRVTGSWSGTTASVCNRVTCTRERWVTDFTGEGVYCYER